MPSCCITRNKWEVLMPNFPMWACPKPAGLPTSQAQPAFNVLLFQKNWPTYLLRYTMYLDSKESGVNEPSRDSLSHNLRFLHRLWRRAAHAPAALNSCAGTRHARHRRPVTTPSGATGAAYIRPVVLVLGCTTIYMLGQ